MEHATTAEGLFRDLQHMPAAERQKFFLILSSTAFPEGDMSHAALFGHLADAEFSAQEAAEYLEVSISTFRRFIASGKLTPSATLGRNQMFAAPELKAFKKALKTAKGISRTTA